MKRLPRTAPRPVSPLPIPVTGNAVESGVPNHTASPPHMKKAEPTQVRPWKTFGCAAAAAVVLIVVVILVGKPREAYRNELVVFLSAVLSIIFGVIGSVITVAFTACIMAEVPLRNGKLKATGAIAAFLVVTVVSFVLVSRELRDVRAKATGVALKRYDALNRRIADNLTRVGQMLPLGASPRLDESVVPPEVDGLLKQIEDDVAQLDAEFEVDRTSGNSVKNRQLATYYRGTAEYLRGNPDEALALVAELVGDVAANANVDLLRARCRMELGEWPPAIKLLGGVLNRYPTDARLRFLKGIAHFRLRDFKGAADVFESVANGMQVLVKGRDERTTYAIAALFELVARRSAHDAGAVPPPSKVGMDREPKGAPADPVLAGKVRRAVTYFEDLIANPTHVVADVHLWRVAAAVVYQTAAALEPYQPQRHVYLGEAITRLRELAPRFPQARLHLALVLLDHGVVRRDEGAHQAAYECYSEAAGILDKPADLPQGQSPDRKVVADAHLGCGEASLKLDATKRAVGRTHLASVIKLLESERPPPDEIIVLIARARSSLAIHSLYLNQPDDARRLAEQIVSELEPVKITMANATDRETALKVARAILAPRPAAGHGTTASVGGASPDGK